MDFDEWCEANIDMIGEKLAEIRGGCSCHLNPPCGNHSDPITEDEAEELGWERDASDTPRTDAANGTNITTIAQRRGYRNFILR